MDALAQAKMECLRKALNQTRCLGGRFEYCLDEKTGQLLLCKKQDLKQEKDKFIDNRFEILDL